MNQAFIIYIIQIAIFSRIFKAFIADVYATLLLAIQGAQSLM